MRSPFPGMDPYLESPKYWSDFHGRFISDWCVALNEQLPRRYKARLEERIQLICPDRDDVLQTRPDSSILRVGGVPLRMADGPDRNAGVADLPREPIIIPIEMNEVVEETTRYIRVVQHPDHALVAVLELLSPSNKVEPGRGDYLVNRRQWFRQPVHLVELDLIVKGKRLPVRGALPQADYFAFVTRWERRPDSEVYAWSVREPMPMLRVPLCDPDPDLVFDLQSFFTRVFERGYYEDWLDYRESIEAPLSDPDRQWAEQRARTA